MAYTYEYPRPAVCVDCVVFGLPDLANSRSPKELSILLIERGHPPFAAMWALPGGFIDIDEPLETAAFRELYEETGIRPKELVLAGVYGNPGRDPRGRTISVVYRAVVWRHEHRAEGGDDACRAQWFPLVELPPLAFDHEQIVKEVTQNWRREVRTQPFGRSLLASPFTLSELTALYEIVLGQRLDKKRLYRFLLKHGVIESVRDSTAETALRPRSGRRGQHFRFCDEVYDRLLVTGLAAEVFQVNGSPAD